MIDTWVVERFKSIYSRTSLKMAPLTVFAGTNNSGKSTVIQSILLTAQTLQSPVAQRAVTLNGHILQLGTFDDIASGGSGGGPIRLSFKLSGLVAREMRPRPSPGGPFYAWQRGGEEVDSIQCDFEFSAKGATEKSELLQLQPALEACSLQVEYGRGQQDGVAIEKRQVDLKEYVDSLKLERVRSEDLSSLEYKVIREPSGMSSRYAPFLAQSQVVGISLYHFVPRLLLVRYDAVEEQAKQLANAFAGTREYWYGIEVGKEDVALLQGEFAATILKACDEILKIAGPPAFYKSRVRDRLEELRTNFGLEAFRNFITSLNTSHRSTLFERLAEITPQLEGIARRGRPPDYRTRYVPVSDPLDFAGDYISDYFQRLVKYLAPLRDAPKPVYPLSGATDPTDVGFRGEHTAAVLEVNRNRTVQYIPTDYFSSGASGAPRPELLETAVHEWLQYMGVVTDVRTYDKGKLGHELKVATAKDGCLRDLTHVGVGVSQVVPIVVLSLVADAGSTLIFEQPELHLHPRVQSRLADFFLSMTQLGKQCIVETHSEHLVNRLRQRAATANGGEFADRVMVYFVEAPGGRSSYRPIRINEFGAVAEWPKGFFDEGEELSAAILKASLEKRRAVRGRKND
jgi:predicted ATPase